MKPGRRSAAMRMLTALVFVLVFPPYAGAYATHREGELINGFPQDWVERAPQWLSDSVPTVAYLVYVLGTILWFACVLYIVITGGLALARFLMSMGGIVTEDRERLHEPTFHLYGWDEASSEQAQAAQSRINDEYENRRRNQIWNRSKSLIHRLLSLPRNLRRVSRSDDTPQARNAEMVRSMRTNQFMASGKQSVSIVTVDSHQEGVCRDLVSMGYRNLALGYLNPRQAALFRGHYLLGDSSKKPLIWVPSSDSSPASVETCSIKLLSAISLYAHRITSGGSSGHAFSAVMATCSELSMMGFTPDGVELDDSRGFPTPQELFDWARTEYVNTCGPLIGQTREAEVLS